MNHIAVDFPCRSEVGIRTAGFSSYAAAVVVEFEEVPVEVYFDAAEDAAADVGVDVDVVDVDAGSALRYGWQMSAFEAVAIFASRQHLNFAARIAETGQLAVAAEVSVHVVGLKLQAFRQLLKRK